MKKLFMLTLFVLAGYQGWEQLHPYVQRDYDESYVAVYGRDSCGYTKQMLAQLESARINYYYFVVDELEVSEKLHSRMQAAGLSINRYKLPVVDVNGVMSTRPEVDAVIGQYSASL